MQALLRTALRSHGASCGYLNRQSLLCLRRNILTLAIETSCDDTSVAIVEKKDVKPGAMGNWPGGSAAVLHFHEKITSNNSAYGGVHPIVSLESHQETLASLVDEAILHLPGAQSARPGRDVVYASNGGEILQKSKPDFISVTRGPGMRSNLTTGLDTAKGLAVAWQIPLVGVHHMQAHALTPRLVSALESGRLNEPEFPFLSLLVSGGHTLLILSASLTDHRILASTSDTAIGDCLDKIARAILPADVLSTARGTMYGALLEHYAFPNGEEDFAYTPPKSQSEELKKRMTEWGWGFNPPFAESPKGLRAKSMEFSFAGFTTAAERFARFRVDRETGKLSKTEREEGEMAEEERRALAREAMRVTFEHLAGRAVMGLQGLAAQDAATAARVSSLVVSGGVAANGYLKHM